MKNQMSSELFAEYKINPLGMDEKVRKEMELPDNKYYSVSMWPHEGRVTVTNLSRVVHAKKVSKSDQT
jgi:hypothetical protein